MSRRLNSMLRNSRCGEKKKKKWRNKKKKKNKDRDTKATVLIGALYALFLQTSTVFPPPGLESGRLGSIQASSQAHSTHAVLLTRASHRFAKRICLSRNITKRGGGKRGARRRPLFVRSFIARGTVEWEEETAAGTMICSLVPRQAGYSRLGAERHLRVVGSTGPGAFARARDTETVEESAFARRISRLALPQARKGLRTRSAGAAGAMPGVCPAPLPLSRRGRCRSHSATTAASEGWGFLKPGCEVVCFRGLPAGVSISPADRTHAMRTQTT